MRLQALLALFTLAFILTLGFGLSRADNKPATQAGDGAAAVAIAAGLRHTCALTTAGGVKCWGYNGVGQIGDASTDQGSDPTSDLDRRRVESRNAQASPDNRQDPTDVMGLTRGVTAIAAGSDHTCTLTTAGATMCWGDNRYGQLGDGTTTNRSQPTDVKGLARGVAALAAGGLHTCALTTGGGVQCWGDNRNGQLGDSTTTSRPEPKDVVGLPRGVTAIAAGGGYTCALTTDGAVKCWGANTWGQIGDGTTAKRLEPTDVKGLERGVVAIATGYGRTCALKTEGGVMCWGYSPGQLDAGTTNYSLHSGTTIAVSYRDPHPYCGTEDWQRTMSWNNGDGLFGHGTTSYEPAEVKGLPPGVTAIAAGFRHTCALTTDGSIACWGDNSNGQIGKSHSVSARSEPTDVKGLESGVAAIAAGGGHTCALTTAGRVKCWGYNADGQVGDGSTTNAPEPTDVGRLPVGVKAIAAGGGHSCALTTDGRVGCWGYNGSGQIDGSTPYEGNTYKPNPTESLPRGAEAIAAGAFHTCALTTTGAAICWGQNYSGQLGSGTRDDTGPMRVNGLKRGVAAIAAGEQHTCALTTTGSVKCWGSNRDGQIGDGTTTRRPKPTDAKGLTKGVAAIAAGHFHTCALTTAGAVKCWGTNKDGQIGDGTTTKRPKPTNVKGLTKGVAAIAAGWTHTCAVTTAGGVKCWGVNEAGQIGDGTTTKRLEPTDVKGLTSGVTAIAVGNSHTCALTATGAVKCWGVNRHGQLGDGYTTWRL